MPTYSGWNVIAIPAAPAAPAAFEVELVSSVAMNRNPFTGSQQTQGWIGSGGQVAKWKELSVTMPALTYAQAQAWTAFLDQLEGVANVFQFGSAVCAAYPGELMGGSPAAALYWRLRSNSRKYSIPEDRCYRIQFEVMQAF